MAFSFSMLHAFYNKAEDELRNVYHLKDVDSPAIYLGTREDDEGKLCGYVGQAKVLYRRYAGYLMIKAGKSFDNRHFPLSLRSHKDWKFSIICRCKENELNALETEHIRIFTEMYAENGKSYNIQSGGKNTEGNIQKSTVKKYGVLKDKGKAKALAYEAKEKKEKQGKKLQEKLAKAMIERDTCNLNQVSKLKMLNEKYDKIQKQLNELANE